MQTPRLPQRVGADRLASEAAWNGLGIAETPEDREPPTTDFCCITASYLVCVG